MSGVLYFPATDADDDSGPPAPGSKRRRLRGACDNCRQRKVRCDSARQPGNVCSNCIAFNSRCSHGGFSKESDPYNGKTAADHVEAILVQSTAYIAARDLRNILLEIARYSRDLKQELEMVKSLLSSSRDSSVAAAPSPADAHSSTNTSVADSAPDGIMVLINNFRDMAIGNSIRPMFFGRSSGFYLIETAQALRAEHDGPNVRQPEATRRNEFWHSPWEIPHPPPPPVYTFPPKDLLDDLISIYFTRINIIMSCLHRPSFERSVASGLHLVDTAFGSLVLAVCALASRNSDDPRVILEGTNSKLSSGWQWFRQIQYPRDEFYVAQTLPDLQRLFLSILYLQGTCSPQACWHLAAVAVRNLQDLGIHMRKRYRGHRHNPSFETAIEDELYTRVFWMFICSDTLMSAFHGKPRITRDDDYDIDYPVGQSFDLFRMKWLLNMSLIECDDEWWEHPDPEQRFKQPAGKPSVYSYIVSYSKLMEILGTAQKTIYSVKRSQRGPGWGETAVADLDSALNQWLDSIPDHLRWDPNREDEPFAAQSACLYAAYYHVQIQIHRSFIPSPMNDAPLSSTFPSLAICANSARSCSRVLEVQARRGLLAHPQVVSALMDCGIVILLNVWGAGRTGISVDPQRAMNDVQKCISVLKMYELHWQAAGRYSDLLFTMGNRLINNPPMAPSKTLKRGRSPEVPKASLPAPLPSQATHQDFRNIAGSVRTSAAIQQQRSRDLADPPIYPLPISTEELGHLPVYQSFDLGDWGMSLESAFSDTGALLNFDPQQYSNNLQFAAMSGSGDAPQYTSFAQYDGGDWATRDWTTYIDTQYQYS
ncbi:fungal-specific transcription factor domain-containing protein [Mycena olivaceomarginata]|nr:fungal-specific transcription factor domain-containing protein [Mycena olivaceomarginata]